MKKIIASALVIVAAFSLTGCSTNMYDSLKSTCGEFSGGDDVQKIKVSGSTNVVPTVDFMTPLDSTKPAFQTRIITEGSGPKITGNQMVSWDYAVFSGTDKSQITATTFSSDDTTQQLIPASGDLCKALAGVREGSRIALLVPSEVAGTSATGALASQVWVFDIKKVFLPHAVGASKASENGMPTVVRATDGRPSVTLPKGEQATEFREQLTIEGSGQAIKLNDKVLVHYTGYLWNGTVFDSSWDSGQPVTFTINDQSLIKGFVKALVDVKVGSQVLAVIPASLGYGSTGNGSVPPDATLVFVVDVLGISK